MNSVEKIAANTHLWRAVLRDELPWRMWLFGSLVPLAFRSIVYVLVGRLTGGEAGAHWAVVGVVFLAVTGETISAVSDIPLVDVWMRTYPAVVRAGMPMGLHYLARSLPLMVRSLVSVLVAGLSVGLALGELPLVRRMLEHGWILLPAVLSCTLFGVAIIAVSVNNTTQDLVHNTANVSLVVTSGAMLQSSTLGWVHIVGGFLPLQHAVSAMRLALAGESAWPQVTLELLVAAGWGLVAMAAHALVARRARITGRGAIA